MASGLKQFTYTVTASAVRLTTAMGVTPGSDGDLVAKQILFQGRTANTGLVFIGDATVSATDYGFAVDKGVTTISLGPVQLGLRLQEIYIIGTASDKLQITILPN